MKTVSVPPGLPAALLAAVVLAGPSLAGAQDHFPLSDAHRKWLEDEVVYIISDREKDAFEQLQSEAEREAFIAAFWSRRDPEPLTPENEFRIEHYERIDYANTILGRESSVPGWLTDRGRVYIQLGEPDERETFAAVPGLYPAELWFYLAQEDLLLPPLYVLFFRQYYAGPFIQFNHVIHQPEELMPAQSFQTDNARLEAYEFLQEMSPQLAHATITMRADRGVAASLLQPEMEILQTQTLLQDINRAPFRRLDTGWVTGAEAGRGLVESDYLFNFVPSAGLARVLPGADPDSWLVHYAIEIEPQHVTLAREEDGNEYFTRFEVTGEVTTPDGDVVHDFVVSPFLRLTESQLQDVGARPFTYRGVFPLIAGEFRFRVILKNDARTEYTVFEDDLSVPTGASALSRPWLLHTPPGPAADTELRAWQTRDTRLLPNGRSVLAVGNPIRAVAAAPGQETVTYRVTPWSAADESGAAETPIREEEVAVRDGLALWTAGTESWESGRYVLSLHAAAADRMVTFDLNARRRTAVPWGLSDSFDAGSAGALDAALGEQSLRAGDHDAARQRFEAALTENPNLGRVRLALGRFALDDGDARAAVRLLEPALAQAPEDAMVLRVLGDAHRESGNHARAVELYERSLPLQAPDPALLNALSWSLTAGGNGGRAIPYLEQSLGLNPEQPEVRELLATLRAGAPPGRR
jgi:GWxTD domain-containing protein